jgi:hypothetical protein
MWDSDKTSYDTRNEGDIITGEFQRLQEHYVVEQRYEQVHKEYPKIIKPRKIERSTRLKKTMIVKQRSY